MNRRSTADRRGVLCGTFLCVDRNRRIGHWPAEETVAEVIEERRDGGGPGYNAAVDLKKLGAPFPVASAGMIGDDDNGAFLLRQLGAAGVDTSRIRVCRDAPTSTTDAMVSAETGRRTFFHDSGANSRLTPDDLDFAAVSARILHLGLLGLQRRLDGPWGDDANGWVTLLKSARAHGILTNLELVTIAPERIAAIARPCLAHLDTLIVNDSEIGALSGIATIGNSETDLAACRRAAQAVLEAGAMNLVAVHFPTGAVTVTRDGEARFWPSLAVPPEAIAGTNGAGDAFAAGMLIGLHEGWPIEDMMALAHAAAAASLTDLTTTGGLRSMEDCFALARRWGKRTDVLEWIG